MISLKRGVNLSHWLSQTERRGAERDAWMGARDFESIASFGFDHVRLPLDEEHLWLPDGSKDEAAWEILDRALDLAAEHGLKAVTDLHILRSHHFNQVEVPALYTDPAEQERFCSLWDDLATHLSRRSPDLLALEVLNEAVARDTADWNRVVNAAFARMRSAAPAHTIFTGSNWYCMCSTFDELAIPDDANQTLTFHFYNPMCVTHFGASWWEGGDWRGPVSYPGLPFPDGVPEQVPEALRKVLLKGNVPSGAQQMRVEIEPPLRRSRETSLPLYCGEFGVHDKAPLELRQKWLRDAVGVFEANDIGWAVWDWKGVFGVVDRDLRPSGIHEALFPKR